jgi:hypothetical protein
MLTIHHILQSTRWLVKDFSHVDSKQWWHVRDPTRDCTFTTRVLVEWIQVTLSILVCSSDKYWCVSVTFILTCVSIVVKRGKSRHPMRNSGPFCYTFLPVRLSTTRTKCCVCLLFDFSKTFLLVSQSVFWRSCWFLKEVFDGLRLLTHRFPTSTEASGVVLAFFPSSPSPTLPFPHFLTVVTT